MWTGALDTLQRERTELFRTQVDLHAKRRVVSRKLDVIQRRLARLQPLAQVETREAEVVAKCRKGKVVVQLSYVVGGATWRPEYDLRYDARSPGAGKGKVSLTVSAVIEQRTGEDWADAKVALSTAKPRLGARAPQPAALWIDGGPVDEPDVLVQATERREKLATGKGRADSGAPRAASLDDRGQSFLLELPHRATVRADGRPYWFPVDRTRGDAESAFIAVPKLSGHVYRVVRLDNPAPYPLLAGTAHIHRGDTYVGDVAIEYRAPGEPLEVSLGVDSDIRLERIDLVRKDKKGTWLSSDNHMERAYRTVLRSNAKGRRTIELRERLPVSKAEDVRVELDRKRTTRGFVLDAHRGFVTWKVDLGAGKTSRSDLVYAIHVPKSWKLRGRP